MAIRSGLGAQLGFVSEVTWGTFAVPTRFLEFRSEGIERQVERIQSSAIRRNRRVRRSDRFVVDDMGAAGPISFEVANKGFSLLFKHMFGAAPVIATSPSGTTSKDHTFTLGDFDGMGATVQVGRPDVSGVTNAFSYLGGKITGWEMASAVGELLTVNTTWDFKQEDTAQSLASAVYPTGQSLLAYLHGKLTIGGTPIDVTNFSLTTGSGLKTDRRFIRQSSYKKEQIINAMTDLGGTMTAEFDGLTNYNRFVTGTPAALVITFEGAIIETTLKYSVIITLPSVVFTGTTPTVDSPDVLTQTMPFEVLDDGTEPITMIYRTTDVAA